MRRLLFLGVAAVAVMPFAYSTASGGSVAAKTSICHRTTSAKKPYVKLSVSARTLRTHARHAADIIPAPRAGCPKTVLTATSGGTAFTVTMTGEAENPAGDPVATGTVTFRLRAGQGQVCYTMQADNLSGPAAAAHIHAGAAGTVGNPVVTLVAPNTSGASAGCVAANRKVVAQILANPSAFYANVHTADFPGGAMRGQLAGTSASAIGRIFTLQMSGANERPAGDPDGTGTAIIRVRSDANMVCFRLTVKNVALPAVGAHIHKGPASGTGPIVVPFTAPGATGTSTGCVQADAALVADIVANPSSYYANVHTTEFPGGAVRAQLA